MAFAREVPVIRKAALRLAAVAALAGATPAFAQPAWFTEAFLADHFAATAADPGALRAEIEADYGPVPDAIWAAMAPHMLGVIALPGYAAFIHRAGLEFVGVDMTPADLPRIAMLAELRGTTTGILRLSQKRQEGLLRVSGDVFRWIGANRPDACTDTLLGTDVDAAARNEFAFAIAQQPAYVDAYYTIVYAALAAEIAGAPEVRRLEQELDDLAPFRVYQAHVFDLLEASPNGNAMLLAVAAGETDTPALLCEFGAITIDAIFLLTPAERRTVVIGLLGEAAGVDIVGSD